MKIALGRGDAAVAQKELEIGQGYAGLEKMGGAGMAQEMRGESGNAGLAAQRFHEQGNYGKIHASLACRREEQGMAGGRSPERPGREEVAAQPQASGSDEWQHTPLVAFAVTDEKASAGQVNIGEIEGHEFAQAYAGSIEEFDDSPVADLQRCVARHGREYFADMIEGKAFARWLAKANLRPAKDGRRDEKVMSNGPGKEGTEIAAFSCLSYLVYGREFVAAVVCHDLRVDLAERSGGIIRLPKVQEASAPAACCDAGLPTPDTAALFFREPLG